MRNNPLRWSSTMPASSMRISCFPIMENILNGFAVFEYAFQRLTCQPVGFFRVRVLRYDVVG
jgi:hypothetical protein